MFACLAHVGFWINDNGLKFVQLQAIEASGYRDYSIPWPGQSIDPEFRLNPLQAPFGWNHEGRLYASYPPTFALLASLPHRVLGAPGLYACTMIIKGASEATSPPDGSSD